MAIRHLLIAASCVVAVTSTPTGTASGNGTLHASGSESCSAFTSTPTAVANGNDTLHTPELKSCSSSMDGRLPSPTPSDFHFSGNVRRYYIAAEEVEWDYAPTGWDNWLGVPMEASPRANMAGANAFGTKWLKALYRGYTNESFSQYTEQPAWQGTQGPTIRAEVGDMIEIMFVNKMTTNYATMHSMGLEYPKHSEGADYPNTTSPGAGNQLPPGDAVPPVQAGIGPSGCVVYKWLVNPAAGPDASEPARTHSYHSYVSLEQDSNAGLIGPTIIYASGQMEKTMAEYREFPLLYMIYTESQSFLSNKNAAALKGSGQSGNGPSRNYAHGYSGQISGQPAITSNPSASLPQGNYSIWHPQLVNLESAGQFQAPSFFTMNGYIFANNPIFDMCLNDKVIWYVNAYGAASHVFHMHGNGFAYHGVNEYAISINDGVGKTLLMNATGRGLWQVICHVDNHHAMGMVLNYRVADSMQCEPFN